MTRSQVVLIFMFLLLSACAAPVPPSSTPLPTQTAAPSQTPSPIPPSPTPTLSPTVRLVETSLPGPAGLSGSITLAGDGKKPWATTIELRASETFVLAAQGKSGPDGKFALKDFTSGKYDVWILITENLDPVGICTDVVPEGEGWVTAIHYGPDRAQTLKVPSLEQAQRAAAERKEPSLKATGFYAVLPKVTIAPGKPVVLDVVLQCK